MVHAFKSQHSGGCGGRIESQFSLLRKRRRRRRRRRTTTTTTTTTLNRFSVGWEYKILWRRVHGFLKLPARAYHVT